jgi:hypothetical protein
MAVSFFNATESGDGAFCGDVSACSGDAKFTELSLGGVGPNRPNGEGRSKSLDIDERNAV